MKQFDSSAAVFKGSPEQLSKMVNLDQGQPELWTGQDLPAMFGHQMGARLDFDLRNFTPREPEAKAGDKALTAAAAAGISTFRDLFLHSTPPLALLKLAKDFFKRQAGRGSERRPVEQVAYLMYLLSILVARIRLGKAITKLTDSELLQACEWGARQAWVHQEMRELLCQAAGCLQGQPRSRAL